MKRRTVLAQYVAIAALSSIVACGGGLSTPDGPVVGSPGGGGPPPTHLVDVKVTVTVPASPRERGPQGDYLSRNTKSLAIVLTSVDGQGVTGVNTTVMNTLPGSRDCKAEGGTVVCSATAKGSPGSDIFAVTAYSQTNATGSILSVGTVSAKISGNNGGVGISNRVPLTLEGVIASLKLSVVPDKARRGKRTDAAVSLLAFDASGAEIVGPSFYDQPVTLTIEGDTQNAFRLHDGSRSGTSLIVRKPTSGLTMTYDGNAQASPVTLQGTVGSSIAKNAGFALIGQRPPPPVGTIYVLNLGSGSGPSATVTEYGGKAKGNSAPERTLSLSSTLYARSIAVDSSGDLYVGYLDNEYGFSPESGEPDPGNEIAIYAPGASGNDQPKAIIAEETSTSTTIFPVYMAFDPQGRLVTYGATKIDGNAGDAVLTYSVATSGKATLEYGWDFSNPSLRYGGPTGLALDSAGNFFVNGGLHSSGQSTYGLFVNAAANIGNPSSTASREIPWNSESHLAPGFTTNVAVNSSGEIFIGNATSTGSSTSSTCQANANVFAAGDGGGVKPLRIMTFSGLSVKDCHGFSLGFYPTIALYGTSVFVADDYGNSVDAFPSASHGNAKPSLQIAGSATQLDEPIALVVSSKS